MNGLMKQTSPLVSEPSPCLSTSRVLLMPSVTVLAAPNAKASVHGRARNLMARDYEPSRRSIRAASSASVRRVAVYERTMPCWSMKTKDGVADAP